MRNNTTRYSFLTNKPIVRIVKLGAKYHVIGMDKYGHTFHEKFDTRSEVDAWLNANGLTV